MASDQTIAFSPFRLDTRGRRLLRGHEPIALRPKAFDVLVFLAERAGRLVKKQELLAAVWPETYVSESVLKVCISEIREALGDHGKSHHYIETAHRSGYRFIATCGGHLPLPLTSFIGRQSEVAAVRSLLERHRLATLTGSGGAGKTRLAREAVGTFREVWWVELAPITDPSGVPEAIAVALSVDDRQGLSVTESLVRSLWDRTLLLVLDNCEHLIHACAETARVLLQSCPRLRILVTSREPLGLPGEGTWVVPALSSDDAVSLFLERSLPGSLETAQVAGICERLDGLPLAIELAAASAKLLSIDQVAARLVHPLQLLISGSKGEAARQQTMRATIDWSYNLLAADESALFERLSVFSGGFGLEQAEQVCSDDSLRRRVIVGLLGQLTAKSLVAACLTEPGQPARYRLLETVREYASERLANPAALETRHAACFLAHAEALAPRINSAEREARLRELDQDHSNLLAAIEYARKHDDLESAQRIAGALVWYWFHRGRWREGRRVLGDLLTPGSGAHASRWQAKVLFGDALLAWTTGDHETARARFEAAIPLWRQTSDLAGLGYSLEFLAVELLGADQMDAAKQLSEESVAVFRQVSDPFGLATALATAGIVALSRNERREARALLDQSVEHCRKIPDPWAVALPLRNLGILAMRNGDLDGAVQSLRQSLAALEEWPERWFVSRSLESIAIVYAFRGDHVLAAELFGAGESLRGGLGAAVLPFYQSDYDRALATLRSALDSGALDQAWSRGRGMSVEDAVSRAIQG